MMQCAHAFWSAAVLRRFLRKFLTHQTHETTRKEKATELVYEDESCAIIHACIKVYNPVDLRL